MTDEQITKCMNYAWDVTGCARNAALDIQGIRADISRIADAAEALKSIRLAVWSIAFSVALWATMAIKAME